MKSVISFPFNERGDKQISVLFKVMPGCLTILCERKESGFSFSYEYQIIDTSGRLYILFPFKSIAGIKLSSFVTVTCSRGIVNFLRAMYCNS